MSLATVDRVLNDRPGVSAKSHTLVNEAIKKLGYVKDVSAANLAKKRQYNFAFVVPKESSQFQSSLVSDINAATSRSASDRTNIHLVRFPANDPHMLVKELRKLGQQKVDGVAIMAPVTPHVRDAISELKQHGIAVAALVSDQPDSDCDHFIGINNVAAGRTAAVLMGRFLPEKKGKIIVLTNSMQLHDSVDRRLGFDEVMTSRFPHLKILPTIEGYGVTKRIKQSLGNAIDGKENIVGVYSLSSGNRALTEFLSNAELASNPVVIVHELTNHARQALQQNAIDAVIAQNTGHIVRSALRVLRAKSDQLDIDSSQERIRIEVILKENLT